MAAKTQKQKSIWKLGGLTPWELTRNVFRETAEENLLGRASGLAFDFLLALFPLIVFLLSLFGQFASRSYELRRSLLSYFADVLPPLAFQLLSKITDDLSTNPSSGKLTLGILVTLWFASGGVAAMISSLNVVYRVRESRSWFKVRFIALGLTIVISVLILWALLIVLVGGSLVDWVGKELHFTSGMVALWKALRWPTAMAFVVISYALVYCFGPKLLKPHWYWILPGSLFGAFLWLTASVGLRVYLHYFNLYTATYGSLGAAIILLLWLYVSGLAFLVGGEINANIERAASGRGR